MDVLAAPSSVRVLFVLGHFLKKNLFQSPPHLPPFICCMCFLLSVEAVLAPLNGGSLFPGATLVPIIVVTLHLPLRRLSQGCARSILLSLTCSNYILSFFFLYVKKHVVYPNVSIHTI